MKPKLLYLTLFFFSICLFSCSSSDEPKGDTVAWKTMPELTLSSDEENCLTDFNGFGMRFFNAFASSDEVVGKENFAVSPISLIEAVGMLANASDNDANRYALIESLGFESLEQLNTFNEKIMRYLPHRQSGVKLSLVNSLWYNAELNPSSVLANNLSQYFMSPMSQVDFNSVTTADIINRWASKNTNNLINKILSADEYNGNTPFILANATYFGGEWEQQFDPKYTAPEDFKTRTGEVVKVDMMKLSDGKCLMAADDDISMLRLYYKGKKNYMDIIVPRNDNDIFTVASSFTSEQYLRLIDGLVEVKSTKISMPKFELSDSYYLNLTLSDMGVVLPSSYRENGLGWNREYPAFIKQFNSLKVDEKGSEVASVTVGNMSWGIMPPGTFKINEPFMFFIGEQKSGITVLAGIISDPSAL